MKKSLFTLALMAAVLSLGACAPATPIAPTPMPVTPTTVPPTPTTITWGTPTILTDRMGTADDLAVTPDEITAARAHLGDSFVGIIPCTLATEYRFTAADSARKALEGYGLKVQLVDPEARPEKQISAIENFTAAGAKVVVICVLDPKVLQSALREAADKGVFIVQYAGRESAFNGISISIEDADLGYAAGEYAGKLIKEELGGKANVAILDYPDLPNVVIWADNIERPCFSKPLKRRS